MQEFAHRTKLKPPFGNRRLQTDGVFVCHSEAEFVKKNDKPRAGERCLVAR